MILIRENGTIKLIFYMKPLRGNKTIHKPIISKKHYETILDMPSSLGTEIIDIAKKQSLRLIKKGKAEGIKLVNNNFESAGQVIKHFHMHVIPRLMGKKIAYV